MKFVNKTILFFFMIIAIGCNETIIENITSKNGFVQLSKNKVEIGEKIIASFVNMDSARVYAVTLNQKSVTYSQKDKSTIALILPYTSVGNDVGNFVFYCWMVKDTFDDTVLVSPQINYVYENVPFGPLVKWNVNENITENDSWEYDAISRNGWSMQTDNDTIKFLRHYICHDECSVDETLAFINNGNDTLPQFLYANFNRNEWMADPINIIITSRCKIIIDQWNESSAYSGTFSSENYSWVFWFRK